MALLLRDKYHLITVQRGMSYVSVLVSLTKILNVLFHNELLQVLTDLKDNYMTIIAAYHQPIWSLSALRHNHDSIIHYFLINYCRVLGEIE